MRVIAKTALVAFWNQHPEAQCSLLAWYKVAEKLVAKDYVELKQTFGAADYVPKKFTVFDVAGNNYRVVTVIHYNTQIMFIRHVFTHSEYNKWTKDNRGK